MRKGEADDLGEGYKLEIRDRNGAESGMTAPGTGRSKPVSHLGPTTHLSGLSLKYRGGH